MIEGETIMATNTIAAAELLKLHDLGF